MADSANDNGNDHRILTPLNLLRFALLIAPFAFIGYLYRDLGEVRDAFDDATPLLLIVSLALAIAAVVGVGLIWIGLVRHLGNSVVILNERELLRAYARSWIARYIPGVAWALGERFVHTEDTVSRRVVATSMVNEFAMMASTTTAIGLGLWLWGAVNLWLGIGVMVVTLPTAMFFAMHVNSVAHWALDHVGRLLPKRFKALAEDLGAVDERTELTFAESAQFSAAFAVAAIVSGLSFFVVLWSLGDVGVNDVPEAIGGYNLATMLAIALIVVPAGLGVREAGLAAFAAPIVGDPVAATAALTYRVITLLADGIFFVVAEVIGRSRESRISVPVPQAPEE
jgi:uncharacterized membrane protein YbhN (UPF0104 family)